MQAEISEKDRKRREFTLNGPVWKVVLFICLPLAFYQSLNQIFKLLDSMMASNISSTAVSTVTYLSQLSTMLSAIGGGLSVGAGIKISEAYGAGDFVEVKKRVNTLFAMVAIVGGVLLLVLLPFTENYLRLMGTPEDFLAQGVKYFRLDLVGIVINFFNGIYIAVERAKGNSKRILWINLWIVAIKLSCTAFFVYGLKGDLYMISLATIISEACMFAVAMFNMNKKDNAFGFDMRSVTMKKSVVMPMTRLSIPVIAEKILFAFGKTQVNQMSTVYGNNVVGALGISNTLGGIATNPQNGFQQGGSSVISQNIGGGRADRALDAFKWTTIYCVIIGAVMMVITLLALDPLSVLYTQGKDEEFRAMIKEVYQYEAWGAIPLGVNAAVLAMLYGFGKTKITLFMNVCRVFVFRIPVLWALQTFTTLGYVSVGVVMGVSNVASGLLAVIVACIFIPKIKKEYNVDKIRQEHKI